MHPPRDRHHQTVIAWCRGLSSTFTKFLFNFISLGLADNRVHDLKKKSYHPGLESRNKCICFDTHHSNLSTQTKGR